MQGNVARLAVLVLLAFALVVATFWCGIGGDPALATPAARGESADGARAEPAPAAAAALAAGAAGIAREPAPPPGLTGVVLDDLGAPLPRVLVYLRPNGGPLQGATLACTGEDGKFAFPLARGAVWLSVQNDLAAPRALAIDGRLAVELRATEPCIALAGIVRAGDEPVAGRHVLVTADGGRGRVMTGDMTGADGAYATWLLAGRYTVAVGALAASEAAAPASPSPRAADVLILNGEERHVRHDLRLPGAVLDVHVRRGDGAPAAGVEVVASTDGRTPRRARVDAHGRAALRELAPGAWRVALADPRWCSAQDATVAVHSLGSERHTVHLVAVTAGTVVVSLPLPAAMAAAVAGEAGDAGDTLSGLRGLAAGATWDQVLSRASDRFELRLANGAVRLPVRVEDHLLTFASVPPGSHELRATDGIAPADCRYAPVVPFTQAVDVRAGEQTLVTVASPPRALLDVRMAWGADPFGEVVDLQPTVVGPHGPLRLAVALGGECVPVVPGEYHVALDSAAGAARTVVVVADADAGKVLEASPARATSAPRAPRRR